MSSDVQIRFPGVTDQIVEEQLVQLLEEEFNKEHDRVLAGKWLIHKFWYIPAGSYPGQTEPVVFVPTHWNDSHGEQTEKDLHLAADRLEIRIETKQSGMTQSTKWADREKVLRRS